MATARVVRSTEGEVYEPLWRFKSGSRTGESFDFLVGSVPYLAGPPLHTHMEQTDSFYVLEGVLTIQVGEVLHDLEAGDYVSAPPGVPHTFDNIRKDQAPVKACNIMIPAGLDQTFLELSKAGDDLDELMRALDRNGVSIVGPTLGERLGLS